MKQLFSLLSAAVVLFSALGVFAVSSAADTPQNGGYGYHYNDSAAPVMDFAEEADDAQIGTWWWYSDDAFDTDIRDRYLNFLAENEVNEIYFYGYYFLQSKSNRTKLHGFVEEANRRGMAISFIYDDSDLATVSDNTYLTGAATSYLNYVAEYPSDNLNGLHFDIEGKTVKQFANNMVSQFAAARERGVPLSMDVNCQMDISTTLTLGDVTGNIYDIIAANVDTLTLMSYKDSATSIWGLGANAFAAAKRQGCRIVFGVETGDYSSGEEPHNATFNSPSDEFAQEDKEYLYTQLALVYDKLKADHPTGGFGVAIHQHEDWYNLKQSDTPVTTDPTATTAATEPQGPLTATTLWSGEVNQEVTIGSPVAYAGKLQGEVGEAVNAAIQADIRANGPISGDEYYEITTTGSSHGRSGYATTGFMVGGSQIWAQNLLEGCSLLNRTTGAHTQRLMGDTKDNQNRYFLAETMDETTEFVFLSDADGSYIDVAKIASLSITVYRHAQGKPTGTALLGDANDDGAVNMKDVLVMRKFIAGFETALNAENADVNGDSLVNMKDVLLVRKYVAGMLEAL